ncbi:MAG TPA: hypothetical protein VNT52_05795 [Acidimicrobiales bacterium]|nr:hypothetical protein [Acidimicrobiales bacterium]
MPSALRTSVVAAALSVATVAATTAFLPPRVRFGSYSFNCNTVVRHHGFDPIATPMCQIVGAYRLRATLAIAVLLAVLSFFPMLLERSRFSESRAVYLLWGSSVLIVAAVTFTLLAAVGERFEDVYLDL